MKDLQRIYTEAVKAMQKDGGEKIALPKLALVSKEASKMPRSDDSKKLVLGASEGLVRIYRRQGNLKKAIKHLKKGIRFDDRNPQFPAELGHIYHKINLHEQALKAYTLASQRAPSDPHILYFMADSKLAIQPPDLESARADLEESLRLLEEKGVPAMEIQGKKTLVWARVIESLGTTLQLLNQTEKSLETFQMAVDMGIWQSKYRRFHQKRWTEVTNIRPLYDYSQPGYPNELATKLEESHQAIWEEFNAASISFEPEFEALSTSGDWKVFPIIDVPRSSDARSIVWSEGVAKQFPTVTSILSKSKQFKACVEILGVCDAYLSKLTPGTKIRSHCGPTNLRQRIHLALKAPSECCWIRVADKEPRTWQEGKVLVFDDAYEHEVWHNSSHPDTNPDSSEHTSFGIMDRIILSVDVWHPGIVDPRIREKLGAGELEQVQAEAATTRTTLDFAHEEL